MHLNSELLFKRYARPYFLAGSSVLEVGPDTSPSTYRRIVGDVDLTWETADLEVSLDPSGSSAFAPRRRGGELTYLMASEYEIPVDDDAYDVVVSGQVIEHVRRIWDWMPELARVCRPGGHVVTIGPLSWPYHAAPFDCWRIYPEGMRALSESAGLEVVLSVFECLEPAASRRWFPGATDDRARSLRDTIKRAVGWPRPASLDTVTVARKPG